MRVLLSVPWYFPDSTGGTEVYVRSLAAALAARNLSVAVATPSSNDTEIEETVDDIPVFRFRAPERRAVDLQADPPTPQAFVACLQSWKPDVVHQHGFTAGIGLAHLVAARRWGAATVATIHLPGFICARGTFVRFGATPCTGDLAREPCTACRLEATGIPTVFGRLLAMVPPSVAASPVLGALPASARRALRASSHEVARRRWLAAVAAHADVVTAPSAWLREALAINGFAANQLCLCRQGVDPRHVPAHRTPPRDGVLRAGFIGRHDPQKGLALAIAAVSDLPADARIELHVWSIARTPVEQAARRQLMRDTAAERRIIFHLEDAEPAAMYAGLDLLVVPSMTFETGPLVVLEAQAAGLPVVGFDIGGVAERVQHDADGLLVPRGDVVALRSALQRLTDRRELERLRPVAPPRSVAEVAVDTLTIYQRAIGCRTDTRA